MKALASSSCDSFEHQPKLSFDVFHGPTMNCLLPRNIFSFAHARNQRPHLPPSMHLLYLRLLPGGFPIQAVDIDTLVLPDWDFVLFVSEGKRYH